MPPLSDFFDVNRCKPLEWLYGPAIEQKTHTGAFGGRSYSWKVRGASITCTMHFVDLSRGHLEWGLRSEEPRRAVFARARVINPCAGTVVVEGSDRTVQIINLPIPDGCPSGL